MTKKATTSAHTPGDWGLVNHNEICVDNMHETFIAEVFDENQDWRANGRLMAASPLLLKACKMALVDTNCECGDDEGNTNWKDPCFHCFVKNAIYQATARSA